MRMRSVKLRLGVLVLVCLVATVQSYGGCEEECEAHFGSFRSIRCDHEVGNMCVMKEMHYNARKLTFTTAQLDFFVANFRDHYLIHF